MTQSYIEFLKGKIPQAEVMGFEPVSEPHESLKPHQRDIACWAMRGGRRAIFANFGLGKTRINLQVAKWITESKGRYLIVAPLGVRAEFIDCDGPAMDATVQYVKSDAEIQSAGRDTILITNYERVRDGGIDVEQFAGVGLDEASVLRSFGSKTYQTFLSMFKAVPYRFVFTATPSPNRYKELIHYAGYLGVMDTGEALTRFFQRDSSQAGNLTLYPHMERQFWFWLHSWAVFLQKPSDLGYSDEGYDLPPLKVHWHKMDVDHRKAWTQTDSWGQAQLIREDAQGLKEGAAIKRESIELRVAKLLDIIHSLKHDNGSKEGLLSQLLPREQREIQNPIEDELPARPREAQAAVQSMARPEHRSGKRASAKTQGAKRGKDKKGKSGLVCEEQSSREIVIQGEEVGRLRIDDRAIRSATGTTEAEVCDLRISASATWSSEGEHACGSLPQHRSRSGIVVQEMQCGAGDVQRQSAQIRKGNLLSDQIIIWCDLDKEQDAIERELKRVGVSFCSLRGAQGIEEREALIAGWKRLETEAFVSKPVMYGAGVNLQQSHTMIFVGVGYKFADFIQAVHRVHRFQQTHACDIHIIHLDSEDSIVADLVEKWRNHDALMARMSEILKTHKLSNATMELMRTLGCDRDEVKSDTFRVIRNDCVLEMQTMDENSVDMICTSIPFGNQYEYSPSFNDFGHNRGDKEFFEQMGFLVPELLRVLRPGRVAAIHVKDRILFGNVTGFGGPTVNPFSDKTTAAFRKHGFVLLARITIDTDVVRENNQTYRLGWSENAKDSSKMGAGMPEYVLSFRKLPSDLSNAYADEPVTKSKAEYMRSDWQIDAAGLWRSNGNRLPDPDLMAHMSLEDLKRLWIDYSLKGGYSHEEHVELAKALERIGKLPASFMLFPPVSRNKDIWTDIARMRTLNMEQSRRNQEMHVCPLQLDIIKRLITRYTNPGEIVMDPFGGIMSVPFQAIKMGRKAIGIELNREYWRCGVGYCEMAENELNVPTLFDLGMINVQEKDGMSATF